MSLPGNLCKLNEEPCKLLRARPFSFPSSRTKDPSRAQRRRLDICRRLGGPAWSLKRSSDLSALIDGHKPPGSTPRVGKEVPPRKAAFQMLIWGYKYSRGGAAEQQRARLEGELASARAPPPHPFPSCPVPSCRSRAGCWSRMTAAATTGTHKVASTKEERKVSVPCTGHVIEGHQATASRTQKGGNAFSPLERCFL